MYLELSISYFLNATKTILSLRDTLTQVYFHYFSMEQRKQERLHIALYRNQNTVGSRYIAADEVAAGCKGGKFFKLLSFWLGEKEKIKVYNLHRLCCLKICTKDKLLMWQYNESLLQFIRLYISSSFKMQYKCVPITLTKQRNNSKMVYINNWI